MHSSHVDFRDGSSTLGLPVSKTDVQGTGAKRTLECWCGTAWVEENMIIDSWSCPACTLKKQYETAMAYHRVDPQSLEALDAPLLFNTGGGGWSKAEVIASWRRVGTAKTKGVLERELITGHSGRRTGIQVLARNGWARWQIQFMSRHGSSAVDGYIDQAFQHQTVHWAPSGAAASSSGRGTDEVKAELAKLREEVEDMKKKAATMTPTQAIADQTRAKEAEISVTYIRSEYSSSIHIVPSGAMVGPATEWRTACRWRFARLGKYELVSADALGVKCDRCEGKC